MYRLSSLAAADGRILGRQRVRLLAMYLRAFHPPRAAWTLIGTLTGACVAAVAVAPAPHLGVIKFLIIGVAIVGAGESFGFVMRAMFTRPARTP
jgi:hypothetical protein